jgi:hypothetical protein
MPVVQHSYLKLRIIRKFYFFLSPPIAKSRIVDPIFHLHTICTKIPLPYAAEGLARVKKRKKESTAADGQAAKQGRRKASPPRRKVKPIRPQFLCALRGGQVSAPLREEKKNPPRRTV